MITFFGNNSTKGIDSILSARSAVVLTGAGISTSAGIKDFRSETGLYNVGLSNESFNIRKILDATSFQHTDQLMQLFSVMNELWKSASAASPTNAHRLIALLHRQNKLVRYYTQNIDGLDGQLGIPIVNFQWDSLPLPPGSIIQLHGNVLLLRCSACGWKVPLSEERMSQMKLSNRLAACPVCPTVLRSGRVASSGGHMRTDMLLYGEEHPHAEAVARCFKADALSSPDLLLVMGTSLTSTESGNLVQMVAKLAQAVHKQARGTVIYMNNAPPPEHLVNLFDIHLSGDIENWSRLILQQFADSHTMSGADLPSSRVSSCHDHIGGFVPLECRAQATTPAPSSELDAPVWVIIIYRTSSFWMARALEHSTRNMLKQAKYLYKLWFLEWDCDWPLDPDMFGSLTSLNVRFHLYLVCCNSSQDEMERISTGCWPPTRKFFKNLLTSPMCDMIQNSGSSHVTLLLSSSLFGVSPDPLWSLHHFAKRGPFESYVLLELRDWDVRPMDIAALCTISAGARPQEVLQAAADRWINAGAFAVKSKCDMTVVPRDSPPVTFRDADPLRKPYGREISSIEVCGCGQDACWVNGQYSDMRNYRAQCSGCRRWTHVKRPMATRLLAPDEGAQQWQQSWAVAITQFATDDCQWPA